MAAAAGAVLVPLYLAYPTMGDTAVVKSFVIAVLGGLGWIIAKRSGGTPKKDRHRRSPPDRLIPVRKRAPTSPSEINALLTIFNKD